MLHGNHLSVGTQAVALVSHGRVTDVVLGDDMEQLRLCVMSSSAVNSSPEMQILMTDKEEELGRMLKMNKGLNQIVCELQTNQTAEVFSRQEENEHADGRF